MINDLKEFASYCSNEYKNKIAFQYRQNEEIAKISFLDFSENINALGTMLHNWGIRNEKIALIGENSYHWILSYFAVVNGGNTIVPLDPEINEDDLVKLFVNTEISSVICTERYSEKIAKIKYKIELKHIIIAERDISKLILQGQELISKGERSFIDFEVRSDVCSAILYTSGTTSQPKGVMLSHKNIAANAVVSIRNVFFAGTSILVLPLYHTFSLTASVLCVLLSGRTVSVNNDIKEFKNDLIGYQPQNLVLVPMIIESLYKQIWIQAKREKKDVLLRKFIAVSNLLMKVKIDLRKKIFSSVHKSFGGNLDFIISGGAPIQDKYVKGFRELGIQILNGYGITECSPVISVNRNHYFRDCSVGQILDGVEIKILGDEIFVKGDIVTEGYYKNEAQTSEALQEGWFKTGDLGYMDNDGFLYITGRKKNLIVLSNGKNVSPEAIEDYLYKLDYIKEAIVFQKGDLIEAEIYLGDENTEQHKKQIEQDIKTINSNLPIYMNISNVIVREIEFPKTSTKKIRRA